MINLIKPGYVLRFGVDPSTIISPSYAFKNADGNTVKRASQTSHLWTAANSLGNVSVFSHASGALAEACSLAAGMRSGISITRAASYSKLGTAYRASQGTQDVAIGNDTADFVGYSDCYTNYTPSAGLCFSKDFSGCLMVAYRENGVRYVAHAAANSDPDEDCKQAFLTELQNKGATMLGWFRPFVAAVDNATKTTAMLKAQKYINNNFYNFTTFGVITAANQGYAITAFKPVSLNLGTNDWVVTNVTPKAMTVSFNFP
jgi:hypothetical protein